MGYSSDIYRQAFEKVKQRRLIAEETQRETYEKLVKLRPELTEIDNELAAAGVRAAKAAINGGDVMDIKKYADCLSERKSAILAQLGIDKNCLIPDYECKKCSDTGYVNGRFCKCVRTLARDIAYSRLNQMAPLELSDFSSFSLDYYSDRTLDNGINPSKIMTDNFMFSMEYASNFSLESKSILFMGPTGLGKTHLSLAIAKTALGKGYGVVYGSVQNFISAVEKEHFGKAGGASSSGTLDSLLECDLLILDDLGAEFSTSFAASVLYNIINTRILASRPMIISTNLSLKEIETRYSDRILSRIAGHFFIKKFCGEDIRKIKAFG